MIAIAFLIGGICLATVTDVRLTFVGLCFGCLGPLCGTINALSLKHVQSTYGCTGNQLLLYIAPWVVATQVRGQSSWGGDVEENNQGWGNRAWHMLVNSMGHFLKPIDAPIQWR